MPKMTRAHFELIADTIRRTQALQFRRPANLAVMNDVVLMFAQTLADTNPNFNQSKFIKACKGGK